MLCEINETSSPHLWRFPHRSDSATRRTLTKLVVRPIPKEQHVDRKAAYPSWQPNGHLAESPKANGHGDGGSVRCNPQFGQKRIEVGRPEVPQRGQVMVCCPTS